MPSTRKRQPLATRTVVGGTMRRSRSGGIGVGIARSPWNNLRMQRLCLRLILALVGLFANKERTLSRALRATTEELCALCPPHNTLRDWYKHFQQYGELPAATVRRTRRCRSHKRHQRRGGHAKWQPEQIRLLKDIVDSTKRQRMSWPRVSDECGYYAVRRPS
jgi:hypothetical protein